MPDWAMQHIKIYNLLKERISLFPQKSKEIFQEGSKVLGISEGIITKIKNINPEVYNNAMKELYPPKASLGRGGFGAVYF